MKIVQTVKKSAKKTTKKTTKETTKEKLLNTAIKLFANKGFDAVSTREICNCAGVNLCSISYHFGGKKELYQAIIDDLTKKQLVYAKTFLDITINPKELSKKEQIELLFLSFNKIIDFLYANVSKDLIILLLKEQQKENSLINSPVFNYLRKLIAAVFNGDENDKKMVFKSLFIIAQINCAKILPAFSLGALKQKEFQKEDIQIIKDNIKFYIKLLLKEENIAY